MRILMVIDGLGPGGAQRQMVSLALGLKARGHQVEFFVYYPEYHFRPWLDEAGIPLHLHQKTSRLSLAPVFALARLLRAGNFDIVLAFLETPSLYAELATLVRGPHKLIVSERLGYRDNRLNARQWLLQQAHRLADWITVNSHHQREAMQRQFPWMSRRLVTIWNGYDLQRFAPAAPSTAQTLDLRLLVVASVSKKKNPLSLARALKLCRDTYGLRVWIAWAGTRTVSGEGEAAAAETDAFLAENGLMEQWQWLGVRDDIPALLASCDALIHPSFFEGLPNAVCEAMACGRPVLVSRVCDHPQLVQEGISGFLFDPSLPEDIARAIAALAALGSIQRTEMGLNGRAFAERQLSLSRLSVEYEELMQRLTS